MAGEKKSALFVCLGNICRSPIAEAVFNQLVKEAGLSEKWSADSAATADYHTGKPSERRARTCGEGHGLTMAHRARPITTADFTRFDVIFGMDEENMHDLESLAPSGSTARLCLLGSFDPEGQTIIRDPYYDSGSEGFEEVYVQCVRSCRAFLEKEGRA